MFVQADIQREILLSWKDKCDFRLAFILGLLYYCWANTIILFKCFVLVFKSLFVFYLFISKRRKTFFCLGLLLRIGPLRTDTLFLSAANCIFLWTKKCHSYLMITMQQKLHLHFLFWQSHRKGINSSFYLKQSQPAGSHVSVFTTVEPSFISIQLQLW